MPNNYNSSFTGQHNDEYDTRITTLEQLNDEYDARITALENFRQTFLDTVYPIGSIYISMDETDPGTLFGGTWERISGRFLLGCGGTGPGANNYTSFGSLTTAQETWFSDLQPGSTGGEYFHTLSVDELPSHRHSRLYADSGVWATEPLYGVYLYNTSPQTGNLLPNSTNWGATNANMQHTAAIRTGATGSSQSHNNFPPYITVAMWKRTA